MNQAIMGNITSKKTIASTAPAHDEECDLFYLVNFEQQILKTNYRPTTSTMASMTRTILVTKSTTFTERRMRSMMSTTPAIR